MKAVVCSSSREIRFARAVCVCVYYDLSREGIVEIRVKIIQQGNNKERILSIKQFLKICIVERDESNNNALVIKEKIREKTKKKRIYI